MRTSHPANTAVNPTLAKDIQLNNIKGRVIVQPKLDGIRAIWNPISQQLHTRNGNIINSCTHIIQAIHQLNLQNHCLDGEIFTTDLAFETINGLVRKHKAEAQTLNLQYHIFDLIDDQQTAESRAKWLFSIPSSKTIKPVATFITQADQVKQHYQCFLDSGLEGIIVRDPSTTYQHGRSNSLGRIKPTHDIEATLTGFDPTTSKANSKTFGALILRLPNGKTFKCAGITTAQRIKLWQQKPIGASITITFKALTANGIPREPRFKSIRTDINPLGAAA